ncbi:phosphoribosylanthranilate isomerase [Chryseobacterium polytrichastri]|uniref:N-(5'-phosphoribosyl)anthranilate isomerase n=1 Tax=Chryseobacterium polytrichastri TaxID=1302687 RepID=A0A1M6QN47_9FLAO|nr:phosphoribosylanthranilate isomerase [Chryseobacterium polytrichastri]SHK21447.1 phosphoribosylanthranilate isomerase [Chryseobacterium polytrichastri]
MNTPLLKVCGLTKLDQIQELISMNTDFLGFIFYEKSPRYVLNHLSLEDISKINHQGKVGVFVNEEVNTILEITQKANLNFIQLHGDESEDFISELKEKLDPETGIIKVFRIGDQNEDLAFKIDNLKSKINYLLFDTDSNAFGGTGKQFDWTLLNKFKIPLPYFLSGGISEENIHNMEILNQKPFALDINSKFELEAGIKDVEKIKKFKALYQ